MRRALIGIVAVASAASLAAQQPRQVFRTGIDVVMLEASVLDGDGQPIADLTAKDFTVTVGGKPRPVRAARFFDRGGMDSITQPAESSTAPVTNATDDGRIVVFVIDRDSIAPGAEKAILESATSLLDGLRPADAAGVLELPDSSLELTRDHARVRAAIMRTTGSRPAPLTMRDYDLRWDEALAYERGDALTIRTVVERECSPMRRPDGLRQPCPPELADLAGEMLREGRSRVHSVFGSLSALATQLAPLRGPKQIVLLSGGFPFGQDLLPLYDQFAKLAADAQIVFYAVHLDQPGTDASAHRTMSSAYGGADFASGLGNVASMTGGAFFMASGTAAGVFQRISNEIHSFYELAVETEPGDFAGALDVDVKVTRPGAKVRNRRRVMPPLSSGAANADRLSDLLRQPIDVGEVAVALSTYTMRGDDPSTLRTIVGLEAGGASQGGPAEWGFAVFNDGNVVATGRQKLDAVTGPWTAAMSAKLLPGKYRLRAALLDGSQRAGVVERALDVGLRGTQQVQFSDLLVGVADANGRLQPASRVTTGVPMSALIEVMSADQGTLEKVRTMIEIVPGGSATPVKRFLMGAHSGTSAAILTNQVTMPTAGLGAGRYTAIATPMIDDQPLGKVSRIFEIVEP